MFGIGARELVVSAVIALIVFGPERLPELAAQLAKALRDVRRLSDELTGEFQRSLTRDDPATPDPTPAARETVAPATADAAGSAIARSLRVETIPTERIIPTPTAPEATSVVAMPATESAYEDTAGGSAPITGTTKTTPPIAVSAVAGVTSSVGDTPPAKVPNGQPDPVSMPMPMSTDEPIRLAAAPTTTSQTDAVLVTTATGPPARPSPMENIVVDGAMPHRARQATYGLTPREPGESQTAAAVFRERRRDATYRRPRR